MRRTPYRVDPEDRRAVLLRDGACLLSKIEPGHVCRDIWGDEHAPDDLDRLTLEHVHLNGSMMGKRAPSVPESMVALDGAANFRVPSKSQRNAFRAYLRGLYPVTA